MGRNTKLVFVLVIVMASLACCMSKPTKNQQHITLTANGKTFTDSQAIKLYDDTIFGITIKFGYQLHKVSYGIDGTFRISQVIPKDHVWSDNINLAHLDIKTGVHKFKAIGTPRSIDNSAESQEFTFEVIVRPELTFIYDRKNTQTAQLVTVSTTQPVTGIALVLPDGTKKQFERKSPTSFSITTILPPGQKGFCSAVTTDEYGNSVSKYLPVDMGEKRLWFTNSFWDQTKQKDINRLMSCNTELSDVVVHMDTEEFDKIIAAQDEETVNLTKQYGIKERYTKGEINLQGITPDKRYISFTTTYINTYGIDQNVKAKIGDKNCNNVGIAKYSFTIFDMEAKTVVFKRSKHTVSGDQIFGSSYSKKVTKVFGAKIFPLYLDGDNFYLLEQNKTDEDYDPEDKLRKTRIQESLFATAKVIEFSFKDYSAKYIEPKFDIMPWVTFNIQDAGIFGMTGSKFYINNKYAELPTNAHSCFANVMSITDAFGNKQVDINALNNKLSVDEKELFASSAFMSAFKLNGKPYAIYDVTLTRHPDDPNYTKQEKYEMNKDLPSHQFFLVPVNNDEASRELAIDESFERYMFIRSNPILNGKAFFYLRKSELQDASGNVTRKNGYFIALFDGKNVDIKEIKPDNRLIDWGYNDFCSLFFE